jgi:hypothetical protein
MKIIKDHLLKIVLAFHRVFYHKQYTKIPIELFSLLVSGTKSNDLTQIYDEKLRLLRQLKPEFFDNQGNLLSRHDPGSHSYSQPSAPSSKK